jgi:hypothetical protein
MLEPFAEKEEEKEEKEEAGAAPEPRRVGCRIPND